MSEVQNKKGQINIELDETVAAGTYSNLAIINHSVSEFIVDFIRIMPGVPKAKVKSRIILTPQHAKRLTKALAYIWKPCLINFILDLLLQVPILFVGIDKPYHHYL